MSDSTGRTPPDYQPFQAPVSGGMLAGGIWHPETPGLAVLAIHGITASHLTWPLLAAQLDGVRVIAPDLRGRARSNALPGPFGLRQHADDMVALLGHLDAPRVAVVGHSMGAFVAVWLAHQRPDLVESLVLVDGGLPIPRPDNVDPTLILGPAAERLTQTFPSRAAYAAFWRAHPAFVNDWSPMVADYVNYDLDGLEPSLHSSALVDAVAENVMQLNGSDGYSEALAGLTLPIDFLRAPRGLLNEPAALYSRATVAEFAGRQPTLTAHEVENVNHYTIIMSERGASRVASVVQAQIGHTGQNLSATTMTTTDR